MAMAPPGAVKAVPIINLTGSTRHILTISLLVAHLINMFTSVMLIGNALYIKFSIQSKSALTADYNNDVLPYVMIGIGCLNLIVCAGGAGLCYLTLNVDYRFKTRALQLPYVCVATFSAICVFGVAMLALGHVGPLHSSFSDGLIRAMERYKTIPAVKKDVDELQMYYQCCGSISYRDWFNISWVSNEYLNLNQRDVRAHLKGGHFFTDDVPFCCCDPEAVRPCIHHLVSKDLKHHKYKHEQQTTLYDDGCHDALMDYFSLMLHISTIVIVGIFGLQIFSILGMRLLQTSVYQALDQGDPELNAPGWLFGSLPKESIYNNLPEISNAPPSVANLDDLSPFDSLEEKVPTASTNIPSEHLYEDPGNIPSEHKDTGNIPSEHEDTGNIPSEHKDPGNIPSEHEDTGNISSEHKDPGNIPSEHEDTGNSSSENLDEDPGNASQDNEEKVYENLSTPAKNDPVMKT